MNEEVTDFLLPKNFAVRIQRRGVDRFAVQKVDEQALAIPRDGRRGR